MTKGHIAVLVFLSIIITIAVAVKVKYGGLEIVTNETSRTLFRDAKELEKKIRSNTNTTPDDWKKVEEIYLRLLRKYPDSEEAPYANLKLARVYAKGYEEYDRAIEQLRSVLSDYPDLEIRESVYAQLLDTAKKRAKKTGDNRKLVSIYKEYIREFPGGRTIYEMGRVYLDMEETASAHAAFERTIKEYPEGRHVDKAKFRLAMIELDGGDIDKAKELLLDITRNYPDSATAEHAGKKLNELMSRPRGRGGVAAWLCGIMKACMENTQAYLENLSGISVD